MVHERKFTPSVVEPSFGIGRIIYSLLEHSFRVRDGDEQRTYLKFNPVVAPVKCALLPLTRSANQRRIVSDISATLQSLNVAFRVDDSGTSIGKRYARSDEIGVPFAVTVDDVTERDGTVTLRERDSTAQVRGSLEVVVGAIGEMCRGRTWEDATGRIRKVGDAGTTCVRDTGRGCFRRPVG